MNAGFNALPEWLGEPFLHFQENVLLLVDAGHDELARRVVSAIYPPTDWTTDQRAAFEQAKTSIIAGIDALIADAVAANPLNSPEAKEMLALAAQRRSA